MLTVKTKSDLRQALHDARLAGRNWVSPYHGQSSRRALSLSGLRRLTVSTP